MVQSSHPEDGLFVVDWIKTRNNGHNAQGQINNCEQPRNTTTMTMDDSDDDYCRDVENYCPDDKMNWQGSCHNTDNNTDGNSNRYNTTLAMIEQSLLNQYCSHSLLSFMQFENTTINHGRWENTTNAVPDLVSGT